jgi:hypothetical protein
MAAFGIGGKDTRYDHEVGPTHKWSDARKHEWMKANPEIVKYLNY